MTVLLAGALCVASAAAHAQNTTEPATTNTPATNTIGPQELQNFSLPGTTTRPAEQPATPATPNPAPSRDATQVAVAPRSTAAAPPASRQPGTAAPSPDHAPQAPSASSLQLPVAPTPQPPMVSTPAPQPAVPAGTVTPERMPSLLPWLIAAFALAAGILLLLWWRRPREAVADGPQVDLFVAPELAPPSPPPPAPEPKPVPATTIQAFRKTAAPAGVVSARLRPALEIAVQPLRCLVEDSQVTIEFELELFNSGTAPARFVHAEASLLNASATQDQELAAFFANPAGIGDRVNSIPPMQRINLTNRVVAPREAVHEHELGGHKAFVPVIAFNALYEWTGGSAQTSAAYLVGRETRGGKLGPFNLDRGACEFRGLAAKQLPAAVRS